MGWARRSPLPDPPVVLGTDDLPHDLRDLHTRFAQLRGTSGILGAETHVQKRHGHSVNTGCLYVKGGVGSRVAP